MASSLAEAPPSVVRLEDIATAFDAHRRALRLEIGAGMIVAVSEGEQPDVAVMGITARGFWMATNVPLPVNAVFSSAVVLDDGSQVQPRARVVCCQWQRPDGHDGGFLNELEFVNEPAYRRF